MKLCVNLSQVNHISQLSCYYSSNVASRYGTRMKKVNILRAYYGYGRTTTTATGGLRLRACYRRTMGLRPGVS